MRWPRPSADPGGPEHRRADRHGRRLARLGDPVEQERQDEREHEAADASTPARRAGRRAASRAPRVAGEHERPQRPRHGVELVQRDESGERATRPKSHQPPSQTSQSTSGQPTTATSDAREELVHLPPNRRRRLAYSRRARCRSSSLAEVRPERVGEDELGVGELPEQEVREPQLARGADQQVGVGQLGRVELRGERVLVELARRRRPSSTSRRAASTSSARPP